MGGRDFEVEWRQVQIFLETLSSDLQAEYDAEMARRTPRLLDYETGWDDCVDILATIGRFAKTAAHTSNTKDKSDTQEKEYCDKEVAETETKKADKEAAIEKLSTQIDSMTAKTAKLKEEVATLQKELAALAKAQAEMDKLRAEQKEVFDTNSAEMKKGLKGVQLALKVLNEYYAKDDKSHGSADGAGSGIIGLLEVCESDFSKGLAEMVADEEAAVAEYESTSKENEITKATKEQDAKYKTKEFKGLEKETAEATADRSGVQEELDAVNQYYAGIKERCIAKPESYAERVKRRESEIAGLKQALSILEGEAVLLQRSSKHTLRGARIQKHA